MATVASHATSQPNGGLIDPTKQAEYPILLGDKLAGKGQSNTNRFIGITYNHKSKSASRHQRATITATGSSQHLYKLTLQDKSQRAEQTNPIHTYHGSVDPASLVSESETSNLVLVFDPERRAFVLEPVSTRLNFNLQSAPGKTTQQVIEQYPQLSVLSGEDQTSGDDQLQEGHGEDDAQGAADESNPYDFRHFLPKPKTEHEGPDTTTPDAHQTPWNHTNSHLAPPPVTSVRPGPKPAAKAKPQTNPLLQQKRQPKATAADKGSTKPKPKSGRRVEEVDLGLDSSSSDREETTAQRANENKPAQAAKSPGANIIVDGDLIIDMGSPPPARPAFKINPRHFSSNNTSANEADYDSDDEGEIEDLRLPSPAGTTAQAHKGYEEDEEEDEEEEDEEPEEKRESAEQDEVIDDDDLAAEMEAAFEESAREEEQKRVQRLLQQQQQMQHHVVSDDESEVSEEE
ncbi:hypothetical protein ACJ73_00669 [Blastomyces percursus]|uniref:Transcription elongation factor Eaf N-terminal domain-containing protein n=1 Tax=Blastomyces percursus TaxID=1658174 RepID=A0A1J9R6D6_9EURO|nr:hypothetical protein ACJ73_00669 [Blastomyces percursus]